MNKTDNEVSEALSEAGCLANMAHYANLRRKYAELALEAMAEEVKWTERYHQTNNLKASLDFLAN